jgi:hypothetical protein
MAHVLPKEDYDRVLEIKKVIAKAKESGGESSETVEKLQSELDHKLAAEHPFYSKRFIESLSKDFNTFQSSKDSWKL